MKRVAVIGCGGVGSWAAYCVAAYAQQAEEPCKILLVDRDRVEIKNLCRMAPIHAENVGGLKTDAVAGILKKYGSESELVVVRHGRFFDPAVDTLLLDNYDIVICATDTVDIQRWLHQFCYTTHKQYIRAGYDGDTINVTGQFPMTLESDEVEAQDAGYHGIPTIFPAAVAGAIAAYRVWNPDAPSLLGSLSMLGIADSSLVPEKVFEGMALERELHDNENCDHSECAANCERSHCDNGDCDHSECHSSDDCDHSECINADFNDTREYVENIHDNDAHSMRQAQRCPYCHIAKLESEAEELQERIDTLESASTPANDTPTTEVAG